ncbi:MAG: hypothetical protein ABIJ17_02615 [Patescibacteria group bacterium]
MKNVHDFIIPNFNDQFLNEIVCRDIMLLRDLIYNSEKSDRRTLDLFIIENIGNAYNLLPIGVIVNIFYDFAYKTKGYYEKE